MSFSCVPGGGASSGEKTLPDRMRRINSGQIVENKEICSEIALGDDQQLFDEDAQLHLLAEEGSSEARRRGTPSHN